MIRVCQILFYGIYLSVFFLAGVGVAAELPSESGEEEQESFYYAVERGFGDNDDSFDIRAGFSYSLSNPYLNVYGGQLEVHWLASPFLSLGVEGSLFDSGKRDSAKTLENELDRHGYRLETFAPEYGLRSAVRFTPISSVSNVFSLAVVKTDISLVVRGGAVQYETLGWGPSLGLGAEINFRFRSGLGILLAALWDWDHVPDHEWENRTSFLIGPSVRF